jgi:hypothetical protein
MTADMPQPATTGITRIRSIHRTKARRTGVADKGKHKVTKHMIRPTVRCHSLPASKHQTVAPSPSLGRDKVVGIATRCELDGPGIKYRWGRDFPHP